ncbi:MAG: molecular chaperone TorD family protein [Pirellulales bacterium]
MSLAQISPCDSNQKAALDLARESIYRFLAAVLSDPRGRHSWFSIDPANLEAVRCAAELLRNELGELRIPLGIGELPAEDLDVKPMLTELVRPDGEIIDEYVRVFGLVTCRECPPYETEYCPNDDTFYRSQQMADISGFYRAFGLQVATDLRERPDYLPLELEFEAFLLMKMRLSSALGTPLDREHAQVCGEARAAFFRDHVSWWAPTFALAVRRKATSGLYCEAARVLAAFLPLERAALDVAAPPLPILQPASDERHDECEGCSLR